jgi:polyisoprenoid-binding protein YceI
MRHSNRLPLLLAAIASACAASAAAERFDIAPGLDENRVRFDSKTSIESFSGKTHQVQGYLILDPGALGDSVEVRVEVDLASLDTGIDLRNQHMRRNHLETDKYPKAVFHGVMIRQPHPAALEPGRTDTLRVEGDFELHGVRRRLSVPLAVTFSPPALRVAGQFAVSLQDYKIARPGFLTLRVGDIQKVVIDLTARPAQ